MSPSDRDPPRYDHWGLRADYDSPYGEAERRIANAAIHGLVELDLSIHNLTLIPPLPPSLYPLRTLDLRLTSVSDLTPLVGLANLQSLNLWRTKVSNLKPLAKLTALRSLTLWSTPVSDLGPLVGLTALQSLNLWSTQILSLSPLAGLTALQSLIVTNTQISDLAPLAELIGLIDGATRSPQSHGLLFTDCPIADEMLRSFARLDNPERTIKTINYLRKQKGLAPHIPNDRDESIVDVPPDLQSSLEHSDRLQQDPNGTNIIVIGDQLALAASGDDSDSDAAKNPAAQQLHARIASRLRPLRDYAQRVRNQPGWTDLAEDAEAFHQLTSLPLEEIALRVAEFWSLSGSFGAFLAQDDEAARRPDAMISRLEPDGRRLLSDVVINAAALARMFPTGVKLDQELREALYRPEPVDSARTAVELAGKTEALRADHARILHAALTAPKTDDTQTRKAHDRTVRTVRNVAFAALVTGGLYISGELAGGYLHEVGAETAQKDILGRRVVEFVVKGEHVIVELLEGEPADKQTAARELAGRIKDASARKGGWPTIATARLPRH